MRDLYSKGYKPSALRYALASVPYRRQLNFTFDGLTQATNSVERLRTLADRLKQGQFPAGSPAGFKERAAKALDEFDAGMADDLNTAVALAAAFDFLREANIAMDGGKFGQEDAEAAQRFLMAFDEVFAVVADTDAEKLKELGYGRASDGFNDSDVEAKVAERQAARQRRDFSRSDEIRKELAEHGIILEDSKDGSVRWKRK
jgi:cysteinyl-tRNA synthetase